MFMKCRECGQQHSSKEIRDKKLLTYSCNDKHSNEWHDCIDGRGSGIPNLSLDKSDTVVLGYDGCRGWP
jgi:hypothetical protein